MFLEPDAEHQSSKTVEATKDDSAMSERVLKKRLIGMTFGLVFAHFYIAIAIYYSYMDDKNHLHTCWLGLFGAFVCSMIFLFHIGISENLKRNMPILSSTLWILILVDIAVMSILQNQDFFQPYAIWAWPSILVVGFFGYFIGPKIDNVCSRLL